MDINKKNKLGETNLKKVGYSTSDYLNEANTLDNNQNKQSSSSATTSSTDDYYQLAKDQEYATLFDKEVALENAKSNALKYTQNQINASGFGGTGYGSSLQSGIYNQYINKAGQAQSEYQTNIKDINQQEKEAAETEDALRVGNITSMLQSSSSVDQMNELLSEYGWYDNDTGEIGVKTKQADGTYTYQKPENMSEDEWIQLKYYYNAQKNLLDTSGYNGSYYTSLDEFKNATYVKTNGSNSKVWSDSGFKQEATGLFNRLSNGEVAYGGVVQITNKAGDTIYVMLTQQGLRMASVSDYNNAKDKYEMKYNGSNKQTWEKK